MTRTDIAGLMVLCKGKSEKYLLSAVQELTRTLRKCGVSLLQERSEGHHFEA